MASNPYEGLSEQALDLCARRMAKTLASKPRRKKTRDYVASIRGRETKGAAEIEKELKALARKAEQQRGMEIARKVLARLAAGDVPAMPDELARRKQRVSPIAMKRAEAIQQDPSIGLGFKQKRNCRNGTRQRPEIVGSGRRNDVAAKSMRPILMRVQNYRCAICGHALPAKHSDASIDHVIPMAMGGKDAPGNWVAVHKNCNGAKSNDIPTGCEMVFLLMVNAKLGQHPQVF